MGNIVNNENASSYEHGDQARANRHKSRRRILASMSVVGIVGSLAVVATSASAVQETKVGICHATSSNTNPYTSNSVDYSSVDASGNQYLNGHGGTSHDGPIWNPNVGSGQPQWGDIIPAFTNPDPPGSTFPGRNATGAVAAILLANNCNYVAPTGSPTATATSTVTATATATATVTASSTATVTASPTATSTVIVTPPPVVVTAPPVTVTNTQVVTVTATATPVATATSSPVAIALPAAADTAVPSQAPQSVALAEAGSAPSVVPAGGDGAATRSQGSLALAGALGLMGIAGMTGLALTGKRRDSE
jgi:hypothetical protein